MSVAATDSLASITSRIASIQAHIQSLDPSATTGTGSTRLGNSHDGFTVDTKNSTAFATVLEKTINAPATTAPSPSTGAGSTPARRTSDTAPGGAISEPDAATATTASASVAPAGDPDAVTGTDVVASAKKYLGVPYVWGGTSSAGLDCSGLVQLAYRDLGIDLPRVSRNQAKAGTPVASMDQAQPGDIIAFGTPVDHVAIYLGNNRIIEAPQPGADVHTTEIYRDPVAIRRIVTDGAGAANGSPSMHATIAAGTPDAPGVPGSPVDMSGVTTLAVPPGFPDMWNDSKVAGIPRAVTLSALGITPNELADVAQAGGGDSIGGSTALDTATDTASAADVLATAAASLSEGQLNAAGISDAVARYLDDFAAARAQYDLPRGLLPAVAQAESGGDPTAISSAGAQGLMQLMPATAAGLGVADPFDPRQAINGAAQLLSGHLSRFGGSIPLSLAAYNAGAGAVEQYGGIPPFAETQQYVKKITNMLARLA